MRRAALLFCDLFRLALFVVGGGYAMLPVADEVFARRGITKEGEILDSLPLFQMVPGIIAGHIAVFVGRRVAGAAGAALGVVAIALPSVAIFTLVAAGYCELPVDNPLLRATFAGLRAGLTGIVAATIVRIWRRTFDDAFAYAVLAASLAALLAGVASPLVVLGAMAVGIARGGARESGRKGGAREHGLKFRCAGFLPLLLFLKYGALCFGGGFVLVPMYIEDFVGPAAAFLQIPAEEFSNVMSLTQMTPGPIGVNGATYFGYRLAGVAGAMLASALLLIPGALLAFFAFGSVERFGKSWIVRGALGGARPASVALMVVALRSFAAMGLFAPDGSFSVCASAIAACVLAAMLARRAGAMMLIFLSGAAGLALCR